MLQNKEKLELVETFIFNVLFTLGMLAIFIVLSALTTDIEKLKNEAFWILTFIKVALLTVLFNWYRFTSIKTRKKTKKGYRKANLIHSLMCDLVKALGLRPKVEIKVEEYNQRHLKEAQEFALARLTNVISLDEFKVWTVEELKKKCLDIGYNKKHTKKLVKLHDKIKKGQIKYEKYTVHQILHNQSSSKVGKSISDANESANLIYENLYVIIRYILFTVTVSLVKWEGNVIDLLIGIAVNLTLAATAMISGTKSADDYLGRCTDRINNKNDLLSEVEGIDYSEIEKKANDIIVKEFYRNET